MENARYFFKKGQKLNVEIMAVNGHRQGIAHVKENGHEFTVFVPGATEKGKTIKISVIHVYDTYVVGRKR